MDLSVQIITLPENTDPGNLNADQINRLKKRLYG